MAGAESKGLRRYDKESLLWQSSLALLVPGEESTRAEIFETLNVSPEAVGRAAGGGR